MKTLTENVMKEIQERLAVLKDLGVLPRDFFERGEIFLQSKNTSGLVDLITRYCRQQWMSPQRALAALKVQEYQLIYDAAESSVLLDELWAYLLGQI